MILHAPKQEITDVLVQTGYSPTDAANIINEALDTGHYENDEFVLEYAGQYMEGDWLLLVTDIDR